MFWFFVISSSCSVFLSFNDDLGTPPTWRPHSWKKILWRRVAERALRGTYFGNMPAEVYPDYTADLLHISHAFAAPLAELFASVKQGHQPCSFIPQKQLMLYASPLFWQYGLLACVAGCCALNNEHRQKHARAAKAAPSKQEEPSEKDVDALTFMQTVIMSFVRGMTHGEQTLPINDLFVYVPAQLLPALVEAIGKQGYQKAEVKSGWGYRPRKEGAEDNPLLVAGVYSKDVAYDSDPQMPDASWAARAYIYGALDPSLGQSMSFPRLNNQILYNHYHYGYPPCREANRPYQQYGNLTCTDDQWDRLVSEQNRAPQERTKGKDCGQKRRYRQPNQSPAHCPSPRRGQFICYCASLPSQPAPPCRLRLEGGGSEEILCDGYWTSHLSQGLSESGGLSHCSPSLRVTSSLWSPQRSGSNRPGRRNQTAATKDDAAWP